ncbi:hypothetical protein [Ruania zhangjianzhongii]|uniref:COG4315 family predicted lipoprotein n=1 Tax=Ruania zhangjianzhongii TaxID=2603206 RepID=UPI0011C8D19C|nr:hypothetical protein [Ruania zhangjianzhongii]
MRRSAAVLLLAAAAVLAGCGSDAGTDEDPEPAAEATMLTVASSAVGDIVADGAGMSLYLFTEDSPGTSTCTGDCLEAWPALEGEPSAGEGIDASLLGTIEREDGTTQATYADWPLYYFAQDTAPGDVTGQGVNEVWYLLSPAGESITEAVPADTSGY